MAQIYGMEQEDYDDLPKGVQATVKLAFEQQATMTTMQTELAELKANQPKPVVKEVVNDNPGPHNNWKLEPFVSMGYETRRDQLLDQVQNGADKKLSVAVQKYRTEIVDLLKQNHPQNYANPAFIQSAIDIVVGKHLSDILAEVKAGKNDWFTETSGGSGNNVDDPNKPKNYEQLLTTEQRKAADNFKMDYKAYYESLVELGVTS